MEDRLGNVLSPNLTSFFNRAVENWEFPVCPGWIWSAVNWKAESNLSVCLWGTDDGQQVAWACRVSGEGCRKAIQLPIGNVAHCKPWHTGSWTGHLCLDKAMAVVLLITSILVMCWTQIPTVFILKPFENPVSFCYINFWWWFWGLNFRPFTC
jgi:hypothetical protein